MKYFYSLTDKNGYIYSIDNCIFTYILKYHLTEYFILFCQSLRDKYDLKNEYWERLNVPACSHWNWYINHIHLCNGIYLSSGKYDYLNDKNNITDCVKLEINLNKHGNKEVYHDLNKWLIENSGSISLDKYDLAIDIQCKLSDIDVFGTNKERGLYKGTRYYGQRNKNGYCKIYDKGKEQDLDNDLTRVEHTISRTKTTKELSLENVYVKTGEKKQDKLNDTDRVIIDMLQSLKAYGEDIGRYTDRLGRGKKQKILEALTGYSYKKLDYDIDLIHDLLEKIREFTEYQDKKPMIFEDKDGFIKCSDDEELPFD